MNKKQKIKQEKAVARAKERGQEYYTPDRLRYIEANNRRLAID